jgi:hypothetical protein
LLIGPGRISFWHRGNTQTPLQTDTVQALRSTRFVEEVAHETVRLSVPQIVVPQIVVPQIVVPQIVAFFRKLSPAFAKTLSAQVRIRP